MLCQQLALNKFKMEILRGGGGGETSKSSEATSGTTFQLQEQRRSSASFKKEIQSRSKSYQRGVGQFAFQSLISSTTPVVLGVFFNSVIYH